MAAPIVLLVATGMAAIANSDSTRGLLRGLRYLLLSELVLLIAVAAIGATYEARSRARDRRFYHPPGRLVDIGGYKLHLHCSGSGGPTVILDYGLEGSYLDWRLVQPEVAQFTRVCSYDRGGYGWSDPSPKRRVPSVMMDELHALLAAVGEKPPYIVVGHSYGGFDALMFAHKFPEETAAVVLVDSSHPDFHLSFDWKRKIWLRMLQYSMLFGLPRWRGWCGDSSTEVGLIKRAFSCQSWVPATGYRQLAAFPASVAEIRNLGSLGELPLVVVSRDPNRPGEGRPGWHRLQEDLTRFSANSSHVIAEGSGHDIPRDRPDVVVDAIKRLVKR